MLKQKGILFILSGPSGVGKGTVRERLFKENPDLKYSISATTRAPRPGEQDGVDYFYKSPAAFQTMIKENKLLEHATYVDNYYGTPRDYVEEQLANGHDVFLEIEVQGALQVKENFPEGVFIFLLPPNLAELKKRIVGRGTESSDLVENRLKVAKEEIKLVSAYDYALVNDDVALAVDKVEAIIKSENCKRERIENMYLKLMEAD